MTIQSITTNALMYITITVLEEFEHATIVLWP